MQSENKPVAWVIFKDGEITHAELSDGSGVDMDLSNWTPLYTSIPTAKSGPVTRDDIIRMAREAGAMIPHMTWLERDLFPVFMRFAERVAAAERESCARVAEVKLLGGPMAIAKAIRARGEK